ncbi:MAG: L,D-transpeptidase [Fibrobacteres bacterium]|jgi:hypothetical protein|nr:L,D-transpeptidase [Fibrobacterota bacterium]
MNPFPALVLVDASTQTLSVWKDGEKVFGCAVSTGKNGMGCVDGSGCTPVGWHRISEVIGHGQPLGARFSSREPTGEVWTSGPVEGDWITTRILWLDGLEAGLNKGPGVDSHERYIYIHGTAREDELGHPGSHGCVRTSNLDARILADQFLSAGDLVWIGPSQQEEPPPRTVRPEEAEGRLEGRTANPAPEITP